MIEDKETVINTECKAECKLWDIQYEGYFGVQDTLTLIDDIKVEMFNRGIKYANRWRKVSEELPNDNIDVLVKIDIQGYIHYDVDRIIYGEWCNGDDGIIEWKPID